MAKRPELKISSNGYGVYRTMLCEIECISQQNKRGEYKELTTREEEEGKEKILNFAEAVIDNWFGLYRMRINP